MAVTPDTGEGRLFVRRSTGLVREASALDATIFNAVFSAPVGATLAIGVLWTLSAFPGADPVWATIIALRPIAIGEEITYDYAFPPDLAEPCQCGAANCRGLIIEEEALPLLRGSAAR